MSSNEKPIKQAIKEMLRLYRLDDKLSETNLVTSWENIMGKTIARHTKKIFISKRVLFIYLDSAALRHELSLAKSKIIEKLNESAGKTLIDDIVLC